MRGTSWFVAALLGSMTFGCGKGALSGGKTWVADMPSPVSEDSSDFRIISAEEEEALYATPWATEPRPRLHEVTTLGEVELPSPEPSPLAAQAEAPVVVNVENHAAASASVVPLDPFRTRGYYAAPARFPKARSQKARPVRAATPTRQKSPPPPASTPLIGGTSSPSSSGPTSHLPLTPPTPERD